MFTYGVENPNCTDNRTDIFLGLLPEEQKGSRKGTKGIDDLLYIDQHNLKGMKTRRKNVTIEGIDYKKAYDMVTAI